MADTIAVTITDTTDDAIAVTVTEGSSNEAISLTVVEDTTVVTTSSVASTNAADVSINTMDSRFSSTTVQGVLEELADQQFVQAAAPTGDSNLEEGDLWYNTTDNKLMVYRNTTWEEVTIAAQLSESSDTTEYSDVTLNGGYF